MARPRTFDRTQVLDRAVDLFRAKGFDGSSLPELVDQLGICRQSLYNEFGDKHGLFLAALERYGERELDAKLDLLRSPGSPLENLRTLIRGWAALASQCPGQGCLTVAGIVENRDDPAALAVVERQVDRLEAGYRDALERAQAAGELQPQASPARLARSLTTSCYGLGLLSRLPGSGPRIGDAVAVMLEQIQAATRT
ncbi:MAG TPA: TetR/AcrR family transcriptional regulator [Planctomycetota bacterium]|nr:TetR/AcrR family transcriptional regulator [Planctomycetota bacterium]HPF15705.1 TetR/AcrR family transcriptional regulator [Planctomycetota bacterium]HRV80191.1 TetR/AcrR family transcriptional regulator [Planctomycetota bacterium]